ncbi:hypothetical protein SprV_0902667800 [Sparganum proliferum]
MLTCATEGFCQSGLDGISQSPLPGLGIGDVVSYKNFYSTTVTNTANYQTVRSTANSIIPTNRSASAVATNSLTRQSAVKLSAIDSPDLPAAVEQAVASVTASTEGPTELKPDGDSSAKVNPNAVSPRRFVDYAASLVRSPNSALPSQFLPRRCNEADQMTLEAMNSLLSANNAFGIYSESPFLRPVTLLRPVRFASPATVPFQHPDPENMVRTLRDLADQKVTSIPLLAILSGAKPNAASLGFYTGYLSHSFTLGLDNNTMRILVDQSRQPNSGSDKYRLILRLAWATAGLYMPRDKSNPSRVLASDVLPRCLSIRVARRNVTLPEPIIHGGQAQKFGHRLRFAIDITDKIRVQPNSSVRGRGVEIDLAWLHAPLEDHALPLLEMVGSGSCTPILNHLLNLPLIQVTLDRVQPIPEFVRMFSSAVAGKPVTDPPPSCRLPCLPSETPEALVGVYDFCRSSDRVIAASETLAMVKSKLTFEDDLQSDGWIPVSLLCPLALTRIESQHFFVQLLADQSLKDAEMVHVDANGHWREAYMSAKSDSSAAVAAKESIPEISSVNPTTVAVPSQLDENSTMSPCIMESDLSSEPGAPIEPDATRSSDCVVLIDDDDDLEGSATQPEQPTFAHLTSLNDCCAPSPPAAVTDEQPAELPYAALDSAPTNLFVDLAASSDEEPYVTMAPTPPLSNPQPSAASAPSSISPTTTESCSLPAVIPSPSLARLPLRIAPLHPVASQPLDLTSHATQPLPPPAADAAAVSAAGTSSTPQASPPPNKKNKPIGDCVVLMDDDQEGSATQPEQPNFAHPTSLDDCCAPSPPAAVTDEQPAELPSAALDSAPTNLSTHIQLYSFFCFKPHRSSLFIDLDASSDEEPDATMTPMVSPLSNSRPTPSSAAPFTTSGSCSLIAPIPPDVTPPTPVAPWLWNFVKNATHPPPPPAAAVRISGNSSTPKASPHPRRQDKAIGQGLNMMATPGKLIIAANDSFFVGLMADQSLEDAEMVHVDDSGQWQEASEPNESDSSTAVVAMGSIPETSSDNPTIAAVPSLPNETSTTSPCIFESNFSSGSVAPLEPDVGHFSDCVVVLDNDQEGSSGQPHELIFGHPTSPGSHPVPSIPFAVTDEEAEKLPSESLDSAPANLFIDLAANSNEEFDSTTAPSPSLSSPQPTPSSAVPPTTMEIYSLPAVIPPPPLPSVASGVILTMPIALGPLNLVRNSTQPPPPPPPTVSDDASGVVAAVSTTDTSSTPRASPPLSKPNKAIVQGLNFFFVGLIADQSLEDAEMVHVDDSGQWQEASEPNERDSCTAVVAMESIPETSSDNPTIAAVPSLPNETSTTSPCILESDLSSEPVAPIEPDATRSSDCVVLIDDDDDLEGSATQPEQPTFAHPTSLNDCCAPSPPAAVADEQPAEPPSEALDSAPTNPFVDLTAVSNEEFDATTASVPSLSDPQPTPPPPPSSAVSPMTTESCSLLAVIPPPLLPPITSDVTSLMPIAPGPLNLIKNATQPPPPPVAADASGVGSAVITTVPSSTPQVSSHPSKPNKTGDQICERLTTLRSYVAATTAAAESTTVSAYGRISVVLTYMILSGRLNCLSPLKATSLKVQIR